MPTRPPGGFSSIEFLESRIAPATFVVTSSADDIAFDTLRDAVRQANASPGLDRIEYHATGPLQLQQGEIEITDPVVIVGFGGATIDAMGRSRIFTIDYAPGTKPMPTVISHFTLTHGRVTSAGTSGEIVFNFVQDEGEPDGGALLSFESVKLDHVTVSQSYAEGSGGGVAIMTDGLASISACTFIGNVAKKDGGGLFLEAGESARVSKSSFALNIAKHGGGGLAVHVAADAMASALIETSSFQKNSAVIQGGGLDLVDESATKAIAIRNCTIASNHATGRDSSGGGIHAASGKLILSKTSVRANTASDQGGGIAGIAASIGLTGCKVTGNATTDSSGAGGGGLFAQGKGKVTVAGSSFLANSTAARGGGLLLGQGIIAVLKNSSVVNNLAGIEGPQIFAKEATKVITSGLKLR